MQGDDHPVGVVISFSRTRVIRQVLLEKQAGPTHCAVLARILPASLLASFGG